MGITLTGICLMYQYLNVNGYKVSCFVFNTWTVPVYQCLASISTLPTMKILLLLVIPFCCGLSSDTENPHGESGEYKEAYSLGSVNF